MTCPFCGQRMEKALRCFTMQMCFPLSMRTMTKVTPRPFQKGVALASHGRMKSLKIISTMPGDMHPLLLHQGLYCIFDDGHIRGLPGLAEPGFKRAVEPKDHSEAFVRNGLDPVSFMPFRGFGAEPDRKRTVFVGSDCVEGAVQPGQFWSVSSIERCCVE